MCGIVGYIGKKQAAPILLDGLSKLEYRGYDSAGMAVSNGTQIAVTKASGRLQRLFDMTEGGKTMDGTCGIGHTRWATHGMPTDTNAHPHYSSDESIAVVHNGIIENYRKLKDDLIKKGYTFSSDTDSEVVANLIDRYYKAGNDPIGAIAKMMHRVEGSYALGILFQDRPGEVYAVRKGSPLIVGKSAEGNLIASDVPANLKYTRDVYYVENEEIAKLTQDDISFFNIDEETIEKESVRIDWDAEAAEKDGYEYFMLKEIYEQPKAIRETMRQRIRDGKVVIEELNLSEEEIRTINRVYIIACGSAYHVGMTAKYVIEGLARIPVEVDLASEFRYRDPILDKNTIGIIISQSGETADSLEALRELKEKGIRTLGIVNVVGSSIAREAQHVMYTKAGPEIAVATTKAYSTQLIAIYLLAILFASVRKTIDSEKEAAMLKDLEKIPEQVEELLTKKEQLQRFANRFLAASNVFFIGRGIDYAISMEGSLKLKEISYIHSEAYAAGELKHGTISLIEDGTLVTALVTQEDLVPKIVSNVKEVRTRGAFVMAVTAFDAPELKENADFLVKIPQTNHFFMNSLAIIPLQLFAYYIALGKGCDIDKPRNLAKSVTVE